MKGVTEASSPMAVHFSDEESLLRRPEAGLKLGCQGDDCQRYLLVVRYLVGLEKNFKHLATSPSRPSPSPTRSVTATDRSRRWWKITRRGGPRVRGAGFTTKPDADCCIIQFGMLHFCASVCCKTSGILTGTLPRSEPLTRPRRFDFGEGGGKELACRKGHRRRNMCTPI